MDQPEAMQQIIDHLKAMQPDMAKLAQSCDEITESRVYEYIEGASLEQCKYMVSALAKRVTMLTGIPGALEDAEDDLAAEIQYRHDAVNPPLCSACNGSGEGRGDDSVCIICHGSGTGKV